jgi:hypothetical protein
MKICEAKICLCQEKNPYLPQFTGFIGNPKVVGYTVVLASTGSVESRPASARILKVLNFARKVDTGTQSLYTACKGELLQDQEVSCRN